MRTVKLFVYQLSFVKNGWLRRKIMEEKKYVKRQENRNILLRSGELFNTVGPTGINITQVSFSHMGTTIRWFLDFLTGTKNTDEHETDGKKYYAFRNSGNVYLKEIRGNTANIVGFTSREIQKVIEEFQQE
jgi:hypothetical protein